MPHWVLDGYAFTTQSDATRALNANASMTVNAEDGGGFNLRRYTAISPTWGIYAKVGRQYGSQETRIPSPLG